jgi:rRNA maturation endonuclease Nob1
MEVNESEEIYVCSECGHEGPENDICPVCGGQMLPKGGSENEVLGKEEEEDETL